MDLSILRQLDLLPDDQFDPGGDGVPGRSTLTSRLAPPSQVIFRVSDPETARALGESLSGSARVQRERDGNGVAAGAEEAVAQATSSTGAPLPSDLRERFESSLGTDLSSVRVHTGAESAAASKAVGAKAYTTGQDIHFAEGNYRPEDPFGLHLLAHEVAHTVQQQGGAPTRQHKLEVSAPNDAAEVEADQIADALVRSERVGRAVQAAAPSLSRYVNPEEQDQAMKDAGNEKASQGLVNRASMQVGSRSVLADKSEAADLISQIDAAEPTLLKLSKGERAPVKASLVEGMEIEIVEGWHGASSALVENVQTKFALQQYASMVTESGRNLTSFQSSYLSAKAERFRLEGEGKAFLEKQGIPVSSNYAGSQATMFTVDDKLAASKLDEARSKLMKSNPEFAAFRGEYETARNQLFTNKDNIATQEGIFKTKGLALQSALFRKQATTARAKAKDNQGKLDAINAEIKAGAAGIMKCVELAGQAIGFLQVPAGMAPEAAEAGATKWMEDVEKQGLAKEAGAPDMSKIDKAKEMVGKVGDPKAMIEKILTMANKEKINQLEAKIKAAQKEAGLADGAADEASLQSLASDFETSARQLALLVENFEKLRDELRKKGEAMAKAALPKPGQGGGNADVAAAARLLTSADGFMITADLALDAGQREQASGDAALAKRRQMSDTANFANPTGTGAASTYYTTRFKGKNKSDAKNYDVDDYEIKKNTVDMQAHNDGSLAGGYENPLNAAQGDQGAQSTVAGAMADLKQWKNDVEGLRGTIQSALGMSSPRSVQAQVPT